MSEHASPSPASDTDRVIAFSAFLRRTDTRPQLTKLPWNTLAQRFTSHQEHLRKDGPMFSPATFAAGMTRANKNVIAISMLVADLDGEFDWPGVEERIEPFVYVAYSTYSSTPDHPKLRVVMPLAFAVGLDQWKDYWHRANEHLFLGAMDPSTKAPSQAYYFPSCPPGALRTAINHG